MGGGALKNFPLSRIVYGLINHLKYFFKKKKMVIRFWFESIKIVISFVIVAEEGVNLIFSGEKKLSTVWV